MARISIFIAATCLASGPLSAEPVVVRANPDDLPRAWVSFADLNLASAAGQEKLRTRIGRAAADVCDLTTGVGSLHEYSSQRGCFRTARSDGFAQMDRILEARSLGLALATSSIAIARR